MLLNIFGISLLLLLVAFLLIKIQQLQDQITRLEENIHHIGKALKVPENDMIDEQLIGLIQQEQEIKAVKIARENLGLSLIEGKRYIDQLKERVSS